MRIGTERARSLGWTDCYTFTKALGERVVEQHAREHRVSIVRPSIIESALERPHVGWIEGFKMAEPLILAYGRGELPEFPAAADTIVDIVPVDHVVAAIVAVLAHPPDAGEPAYFHVSSGDRNPLTFRVLYDTSAPTSTSTRSSRASAARPGCPTGGSRARRPSNGCSRRASGPTRSPTRRSGCAPRSDRIRDLARKLDQQGRRLEFLRRYLDLYREYAQAELRFSDDRTRSRCSARCPRPTARPFAFDTAVIDWVHYLREVHCPAVTDPIRPSTSCARRGSARRTAGLKPVARAAPAGGVAAFFDMDGTLLSSNVIETYLWMRLRELSDVAAVRRARPDRGPRAEPGAGRAEGAQRVPALGLPRVRRRPARRPRRGRRRGAVRPRARPPRAGRRHAGSASTAPPGTDRADHRRDPTAHPAAAAAVRPHRGRRARRRRPRRLHRPPRVLAAGGRVARGVDARSGRPSTASTSPRPTATPTRTPTCRCSRRSATRSSVRPDVSLFRHARRHRWPIVDWASSDATARTLNPAVARR